MILVDTSVWVDYFRDRPTAEVNALDELLASDEEICICGAILTEVLQGFRDDHDYHRALFLFDPLKFLPMERNTFLRAATFYRRLRRHGITIRKPVDCMIAAVAIEHNATLLHHDRDFDPLAKYEGLKVLEGSER